MNTSLPRTLSINNRQLIANNGTCIAYRVEGMGPALVLTNGLTTTTTFWKYVRPIWLQRYTVVTWDLPGHGNSGPALSDEGASVLAQARIVSEVMRAAGVERGVQIGWSTGTQVVLEMYRHYPELCQSLVMLLGGAGHVLRTVRLPLGSAAAIDWLSRELPLPAFEATFRLLSAALRSPIAPGVARNLGLVGANVSPADMRQITEHVARVDPHSLQRLLRSLQAHSAEAVLASLRVPLLIIAGDKDPFAPSETVGLALQRLAPASTLVRLPSGTHTALLEEPALIAQAVEQFLDGSSGTFPI